MSDRRDTILDEVDFVKVLNLGETLRKEVVGVDVKKIVFNLIKFVLLSFIYGLFMFTFFLEDVNIIMRIFGIMLMCIGGFYYTYSEHLKPVIRMIKGKGNTWLLSADELACINKEGRLLYIYPLINVTAVGFSIHKLAFQSEEIGLSMTKNIQLNSYTYYKDSISCISDIKGFGLHLVELRNKAVADYSFKNGIHAI